MDVDQTVHTNKVSSAANTYRQIENMNFEERATTSRDSGNNRLFRLLIIVAILLAVSITVVVVSVAKGTTTQPQKLVVIPTKFEFFTPPTFHG